MNSSWAYRSDVINDTWTRTDYIISYRGCTKDRLVADNYLRDFKDH